jgi:hypothetical protein
MKQSSFMFAYVLLQDAFISSAEAEKLADSGSLDLLQAPVLHIPGCVEQKKPRPRVIRHGHRRPRRMTGEKKAQGNQEMTE